MLVALSRHFGQVTAHSSVYEVDSDLDCCDAEHTGTDAFILSVVKKVWIGVVSVLAQDGCDLLSAQTGAYVNFLTLASDEAEYRSKVTSALTHYRLELHGLENVRLFTLSDNPAEELVSIAEELQRDNNSQHVRFATFHTFERLM